MGKKRIMVVEDEGITALRIQGILQELGYAVSSLEISGEDAVTKAAAEKPDLVLMDIALSGTMDGIEAAGQIYSRLHIPVVYLTAHSDEKTLERAKSTGPFGYILKPFDRHEVRISLDLAFSKHEMEQKLRTNEERFREVVEGTNALVTSVDGEGKFSYINKMAEEIFGIKAEECSGKPALHFIHPDDRELTTEWFNECTRNRISQASIENRQVNQITGEVHHMMWTSHFYYDDKGQLTGVNGIARDITARKKAEDALKEQEIKFHSLFNQASDSIFLFSPEKDDLIIEDANEAACTTHGYTREELIGKSIRLLDHPETGKHLPERVSLLMSGNPLNVSAMHVRKDGSTFPLEIAAQRIEIGGKPYVLAIDRDISRRMKAEKELTERMKLAELNADMGTALTEGETLHDSLQRCTEALVTHLHALFARIWVFNERENILELYASAGLYTRLDGTHSRKTLSGNKIGIIAKERTPYLSNNIIGDPDIIDQEWVKREGIVAFAGHPLVLEGRLKGVMALFSRDRLSEITLRALASVTHIITLGIGRKQIEEQLHSAAITDELTGLFNRRGFFALAEQQCKVADRHKRGMTLLYLDLDGMKNINDELGHKEGDRALIDVAHILRRSLREADIIARIGGDEYAVLLTDTTEPDIEKIIIGHIQNNIQIHNKKEGRKYELLLSIGMSRYNPERPCSIDDLLHRADKLMYEDKRLHKIEKDVAPLLNTEKFERRIYKRFRTGDNCWAELDISGKVKIKTISMGGVHLRTPKPLIINNMYRISISPSDHKEITLTGIVAWSSGKGPESGKDTKFPFEAGLKFIELTDSLKSSLEKFTETFRKPD